MNKWVAIVIAFNCGYACAQSAVIRSVHHYAASVIEQPDVLQSVTNGIIEVGITHDYMPATQHLEAGYAPILSAKPFRSNSRL